MAVVLCYPENSVNLGVSLGSRGSTGVSSDLFLISYTTTSAMIDIIGQQLTIITVYNSEIRTKITIK